MSVLKTIADSLNSPPARTPPPRRRPPTASHRDTVGPMPEEFISKAVSAVDMTPQSHRSEDQYTHVSTLLYRPCPRSAALTKRFDTQTPDPVLVGQKVICALGRAAEEHVRKSLAVGCPEHIWGDWECSCGRKQFTGTLKESLDSDEGCLTCGYQCNRYKEHTLIDEDREVIGNPDIFMLFDSVFTVTENKSVNSKGFAELKEAEEPKADNALQALYYRRIASRKGMPVTDFAVVLYVHKEWVWGKTPYLEFRVYEDDKGYEVALNQMDEMAGRFKIVRHDQSEEMPERLSVCSQPTDPRAKECTNCSLCFSV